MMIIFRDGSPKFVMAQCANAFIGATTSTVVTAGANTKGIIIHKICLSSTALASSVTIRKGGSAGQVMAQQVGGTYNSEQKIYFPAGFDLYVDATAGACSLWYEVL